MIARLRATVAGLVPLLAGLVPSVALAREQGCPAMAVEAEPDFRERFPDVVRDIRGEVVPRTDIDACARVELAVREGAIAVSVTLADGRSALRKVARPEDVIPTLQALLLVPEADPVPAAPAVSLEPAPAPTPNPTPRASTRRPPASRAVLSSAEPRDDGVSAPNAVARTLGFELSVLTGARVGDGQSAVGAGVLSFLEASGWLVGFGGRIDAYRPLAGGDPDSALELSFLAGRRLDWGSRTLDLTAGPAVAMKGFAWSDTENMAINEQARADDGAPPPPRPSPSPPSERYTGPVPRLLLAARLGFSPRSVVRTFVGVDGELGPARPYGAPEGSDETSARMPVYTVGLALGVTVGTP